MHFSTTFGSFAVLAFAALASAIPVSNSTDPNNVGCLFDNDCRPGYACSRNICVPKPASAFLLRFPASKLAALLLLLVATATGTANNVIPDKVQCANTISASS